MTARIALALAVVVALAGAGLTAGANDLPKEAILGCADPTHEGGEWRSYGGDLRNTRSQPAETVIGADNVLSLTPEWTFNPNDVDPAGGAFSNTPVVADGCVYVASNTGVVMSLNADTGAHNWTQRFRGQGQTLLGGVIVGSPVVADGMVFVGVSDPGVPYVAAMDQATGELLWTSVVTGWIEEDSYGYHPDTVQNNVLINASPLYYDGMIFQGFAGNEGGAPARGGFAILDASRACQPTSGIVCETPADGGTGGSVLAHTYAITDEEYEAGYRGASVWCTAAIDLETKYVYACGGNPASKRIEARYANALLKIDGDPRRETFGDIVDAYKGNVDQYFPGLDRQPACDAFGEELVVVWSIPCLQLDLDFGASPNLFTDRVGRTVVGALQKSGVYHTVHTDNMQMEWTQIVGTPCVSCNAASTAIDDERVFIGATLPGQMIAVDRLQGRYRWASPLLDGIHFYSTSYANGVVYTMDGFANLRAFDAATGVPLAVLPISQAVGGPVADAGNSSGVAIARNTVYAASGEWIAAFRPSP